MTGLDPKKYTILEICAVVTDRHLNVIGIGPSIAIHHPEKVLRSMEPWSKHHHEKSGLTQASRASEINLKKAEHRVLNFVKTYSAPKSSPLCGNSIWHDRRFLIEYMPKLESYLNHRIIDVSSVKELVNRWYPTSHRMPRGTKTETHRAEDDILESIEELKFYRSKVFVKFPRKK